MSRSSGRPVAAALVVVLLGLIAVVYFGVDRSDSAGPTATEAVGTVDVSKVDSQAQVGGEPSTASGESSSASAGDLRSSPAPETQACEIHGTVSRLDPDHDAPVLLRREPFEVRVVRDDGRAYSIARVSGPSGEFSLVGLEPGDYKFVFKGKGLVPATEGFVLKGGESRSGIEVLLRPGRRVWGEVKTRSDGPASEALLEWTPADEDKAHSVMADAAGRYELLTLAPGQYHVRVLPRRLAALWRDQNPKLVVVRDGENRFDFVAPFSKKMDVAVLSGERPVEGVQVGFRLQTPRKGLTGFLSPTDSHGRATLWGLPEEGVLHLSVERDGQKIAEREWPLADLRLSDEVKIVKLIIPE